MRRKDREMPQDFAYMVADKCEWAVLSMVDTQGSPYCVPVSIVREGTSIYFHAAMNGIKTDCLRHNPKVCIACVGDTFRPPDIFTTEYESAIIYGEATEITDTAERIHALKILCERHTPTNMKNFDNELAGSLPHTAVWRITITNITGKRKKYDSEGKEMKFGRME